MKVAEISGVLFASCSNAPKRGKKCDELKSLYQNILKVPFCGQISLFQRKTTPLQIPSHTGKRYAIWRRSRIGSALVRVRQPICSGLSAMEANLFHSSGLKHYSTIRLLRPSVKFDGISRRTLELERHSWTTFVRCVWNVFFPIKAPSWVQSMQFSNADACFTLLNGPGRMFFPHFFKHPRLCKRSGDLWVFRERFLCVMPFPPNAFGSLLPSPPLCLK